MRFADRVTRIEPSATIAISNRAAELTEQGVDVVDLSVGEPDFETPENVVRAARESMAAGDHGYTPASGIPELRAAISDDFADDGLDYAPEQVVVTPGAKQALFEVVMATVDAGDEVVLLDPAWVSYEAMVKVAGGDPVRVDLAPHDFQLEPALDALADAVTDETQLVLLNSPANPSGAVFSRAALEGLRDLAVEHDVTVVADEIYRAITYGGEYPSVGTLDGMADRTVTVNGFSKAYAMTGWRLG
ncbi:MAG: aminotransferase class I/II-fold pyridoxal phosphate-dependent enzyme, partial [Halobacteriales archaeon]